MIDYNKNLEFSIEATSAMKDICEGLGLLGIKHFIYKRIFCNASHTLLTTAPDAYLADYFDLVRENIAGKFLYQAVVNAPFREYYFRLWPTDSSFDCVMDLNFKHNIFNGITVCYKEELYCDTYSFAFDNNTNIDYLNFFINSQQKLIKFILYFKNEAHDLIDQSEKEGRIEPPIARNPLIFNNTNIKHDINVKFSDYVDSFRLIVDLGNKKISLTARETQIARLLAQGTQIYKNIALILGIEARTVEVHIARIKLKLRCNSRTALIGLLKKNFNYV